MNLLTSDNACFYFTKIAKCEKNKIALLRLGFFDAFPNKKVKVSNFLKGKTMKLMQKTILAITLKMLSSTIAHQTNRSPEVIAKEMGRDMVSQFEAAFPLYR